MQRQFGWFVTVGLLWTASIGPLSNARAEEEAESRAKAAQVGVLFLKTGRVVRGDVRHHASGYLVRTGTGEVVVPSEAVQFEASDLKDAYRKLSSSIPYPTATQHVALAKWCLLNELFEEARQELREALLLEPQFETARTMLKRLDEVMGSETGPDENRPLSASSAASDRSRSQEVRSLASLPRDLSREYVQTIQPLLMNKCANGSCHGPSAPNEFRLVQIHPGRGSHRVFVERNLTTVLSYVDRERPEASLLLTRAVDDHAESGRSLFHGSYGSRHLEVLRAWVRAVSQARPDADEVTNGSLSFDAAATDRVQPAAGHTADSAVPRNAPDMLPDGNRPSATSDGSHDDPGRSDAGAPKATQREGQGDAFAPQRFNRDRGRAEGPHP